LILRRNRLQQLGGGLGIKVFFNPLTMVAIKVLLRELLGSR
jgi:hypothetical protein